MAASRMSRASGPCTSSIMMRLGRSRRRLEDVPSRIGDAGDKAAYQIARPRLDLVGVLDDQEALILVNEIDYAWMVIKSVLLVKPLHAGLRDIGQWRNFSASEFISQTSLHIPPKLARCVDWVLSYS